MAEIVKNATSLVGAAELLGVLNSWTAELIPISAAPPRQLLSTYEVRLAHSESGEGPRTSGLPGFVQVLRCAVADVGLFSVHTPAAQYIGLVDETGSTLLGLVMILERDARQSAPRGEENGGQ